jgi:hypothetical protein
MQVVHDGPRGRVGAADLRVPPGPRLGGGAQVRLVHAHPRRVEDHLRLRALRGRPTAAAPREAVRGAGLTCWERPSVQGPCCVTGALGIHDVV